jgi:hypothetical protein
MARGAHKEISIELQVLMDAGVAGAKDTAVITTSHAAHHSSCSSRGRGISGSPFCVTGGEEQAVIMTQRWASIVLPYSTALDLPLAP